jgi:hypothetical protein
MFLRVFGFFGRGVSYPIYGVWERVRGSLTQYQENVGEGERFSYPVYGVWERVKGVS